MSTACGGILVSDDWERTHGGAVDSAVLDAVFHALSDVHRRIAIRSLSASDEPIAIADLASDVVAQRTKPANGDSPDDAARRVQIALYHRHLPKLSSVNAVAFDEVRNTIAPGEGFDSFARVLRSADEATTSR